MDQTKKQMFNQTKNLYSKIKKIYTLKFNDNI